MKSKLGIHFPNGGFRDMGKLWKIPWTAFVVLDGQRSYIPEIRRRYPGAKILVRSYIHDWWTKDARQYAEEIADWFNRDCAPWGCDLTPYNEMNLAVESSNPNAVENPPQKLYEDIRDKCEENFARLCELIPSIGLGQTRLHSPAPAPGHFDIDGYIGIKICEKTILKYCKVLGVHGYWDDSRNRESPWLGRRYEKYHDLFPELPIFIKEAGAHRSRDLDDAEDYRKHLDGLPDYVEVECFYIWDGNDNQEGWRLGNKPNIVGMFQTYVPSPLPPQPPPQPVPQPPSIGGWFSFAERKNISAENWAAGRKEIIAVVQHVTEGSLQALIGEFQNPSSRLSYHFAIDKDGKIYQFVSCEDTAYHAGVVKNPTWIGIKPGINPNVQTIGVAIIGYAPEQWTAQQRQSELKLLRWIKEIYKLEFVQHKTFIGHREIRLDKLCPGENVLWRFLETGGNMPTDTELKIKMDMMANHPPVLAVNIDAAIYKYAQSHNLGSPEGNETDVMIEGQLFIVQEYPRHYLFCKKGIYDAIYEIPK